MESWHIFGSRGVVDFRQLRSFLLPLKLFARGGPERPTLAVRVGALKPWKVLSAWPVFLDTGFSFCPMVIYGTHVNTDSIHETYNVFQSNVFHLDI